MKQLKSLSLADILSIKPREQLKSIEDLALDSAIKHFSGKKPRRDAVQNYLVARLGACYTELVDKTFEKIKANL